MFIYSFDDKETDILISKGLRVVKVGENYTVFQRPKKLDFDLSDFKNIKISNKMVFMGR